MKAWREKRDRQSNQRNERRYAEPGEVRIFTGEKRKVIRRKLDNQARRMERGIARKKLLQLMLKVELSTATEIDKREIERLRNTLQQS
jgi:hypothetical protein